MLFAAESPVSPTSGPYLDDLICPLGHLLRYRDFLYELKKPDFSGLFLVSGAAGLRSMTDSRGHFFGHFHVSPRQSALTKSLIRQRTSLHASIQFAFESHRPPQKNL